MTDRNFSNLSVPDVKREPDALSIPGAAAGGLGALGALATSTPSSVTTQVKNERLNGFPEDNVGSTAVAAAAADNPAWANSHDQQCCLVDNGRRCSRVAGNASYNKRIQKTVAQKKLKLHMDNSVS